MLDSVFDDDAEVDTEADGVLSEVLDGIGLDVNAQMGAVPSQRLAQKEAPMKTTDEDVDKFLAQMEGL